MAIQRKVFADKFVQTYTYLVLNVELVSLKSLTGIWRWQSFSLHSSS